MIQLKKRDDYDTPKEAWEIIFKYVNKQKKIWLPFYNTGIAKTIVNELGYDCIHENKDFFTYQPDDYDLVIDNPPYSIKEKVIKKLVENGKPFALFLPLTVLETKYLRNNIDTSKLELLIPQKRIHCIGNYDKNRTSAPYKSCWFCYDMNISDGKQLIFE